MTNHFVAKSLITAIKLAVATGLVALLVWGGCGLLPEVRYKPLEEKNLSPSSFVQSSEPTWQGIQLKSGLTAAEAWKRLKTLVRSYVVLSTIDYCLVTRWGDLSRSGKGNNAGLFYRVRVFFMIIPEDHILRFKVEAQFKDEASGKWIDGYDTAVLMSVIKDMQSALGE
jgi:hypothetical protein